MRNPPFLLKGKQAFISLISGEFALPDGLSPGGVRLLNHLAESPMVRYDTAAITGSNGMQVQKDTAKHWIRSTRAYLDRARSADLPDEVREVLGRFVLTPGGGPRIPSTAEYVPPTPPEVPAPVDAPDVLTLRGTSIRLRYVPGGAYLRGRSATSHTDERPEHAVLLSPFLLGEWPVSNAQYEVFLGQFKTALTSPDADVRKRAEAFRDEVCAMWVDGARWARDHERTPEDHRWGAPNPGLTDRGLLARLKHKRFAAPTFRTREHSKREPQLKAQALAEDAPAVGVDWLCVQAWLRWHHLELPPEAVWEFAALGAKRADPDLPDARTRVLRVGALAGDDASRLGFRGMLGNAWEWCADWYDLYPQDEGAPPTWDPRGPPEPPTHGGQRALPYRVLRGGSWEGGDKGVDHKTRGGNHQAWRALWDSFRPYSPLTYRFIAWQFGLPPDLEAEALKRRSLLMQKLHPEPEKTLTTVDDFVRFVRHPHAPPPGGPYVLQASLVSLSGKLIEHRCKAAWAHQVPGLSQLLAGVTAGAQSGPTGTFAWIDRLNVVGAAVDQARLSFCAWSRVPGMDAWLIVESHTTLPSPAPGEPEPKEGARRPTFPHDHEVFGWLRRAGWDDRRWLGPAR